MEKVLVIPTKLLWDKISYFEGFRSTTISYAIESLLKCNQLQFIAREEAEQNPAYKQLIPYVLVLSEVPSYTRNPGAGRYVVALTYNRSQQCGEVRLQNKLSLGVGGHINVGDQDSEDPRLGQCAVGSGLHYSLWNDYTCLGVYNRALYRELEEELPSCSAGSWSHSSVPVVGLINDDSTDVGLVHLGIVHVVWVTDKKFDYGAELFDPRWLDMAELVRYVACFESWSQFAIKDYLTPMYGPEHIA